MNYVAASHSLEENAARNCAMAELLMRCAPDLTVFMLDLSGSVTSWNANASRILGYDAAEILGRDHSCLFAGEAGNGEGRRALRTASERGRYVGQVWLTRKNQTRFLAAIMIESVRANGVAIGFAEAIRDEPLQGEEGIEDRRTAKSERRIRQLEAANSGLQHLADTDELTGIPNRRAFAVLARREIARAAKCDKPLSILFLDIDRFKSINDSFGHAAGDLALKMVVEKMGRQMRKGDAIARVGGDEFVMLLPETHAAEATKVAERICGAVAAATIENAGATFATTVSVGVGQWVRNETIDHLLARADAALYAIKSEGNTVHHPAIQIAVE